MCERPVNRLAVHRQPYSAGCRNHDLRKALPHGMWACCSISAADALDGPTTCRELVSRIGGARCRPMGVVRSIRARTRFDGLARRRGEPIPIGSDALSSSWSLAPRLEALDVGSSWAERSLRGEQNHPNPDDRPDHAPARQDYRHTDVGPCCRRVVSGSSRCLDGTLVHQGANDGRGSSQAGSARVERAGAQPQTALVRRRGGHG